MDHYTKFNRSASAITTLTLIFTNVIAVSVCVVATLQGLDPIIAISLTTIAVFINAIVGSRIITSLLLGPLRIIWSTVVYFASDSNQEIPKNPDSIRFGRELITRLVQQVGQLSDANSNDGKVDSSGEHRNSILQSANIVSHLPLPLFVFNKDLMVTNASNQGLEYCNIESADLFGKNLNESIDMEFPSNRTLETWIEDCKKNKISDTAYWERVRVVLPGKEVSYKRCDIAAHYNRDNPSGTEFIVTMFDRTEQYQQDDNSMSFVALAVHELRTPLTALRGYIEVFSSELNEDLSDEMKDFLKKMELSANQLNAFVGNILNVSKVDENQLTLHLQKADWKQTLTEFTQELTEKATINGRRLTVSVDPNVPEVAIDKVSIYEVISNLVDNAIKYGGSDPRIVIESKLDQEGTITTTVKDHGVGIPENVVPHIFEKFYRNHRTKSQIAGSGLGLYLSKSLVNAHGGQIWVSSKPDEGSTFGFTIIPFDNLDEVQKNATNSDITRDVHGWIKNHSMYRR